MQDNKQAKKIQDSVYRSAGTLYPMIRYFYRILLIFLKQNDKFTII